MLAKPRYTNLNLTTNCDIFANHPRTHLRSTSDPQFQSGGICFDLPFPGLSDSI